MRLLRCYFRFFLPLFCVADLGYAAGVCDDIGKKVLAGPTSNDLTEYQTIQSAIAASEPGWTIYIENIRTADEGIAIKDKSNLKIKSRCLSIIDGIDIDSSNFITIENLKIIGSQGSPVIRIKSGAKFSHHVSLNRLIVDGRNLSSDGIAIGNKSESISITDSLIKDMQGNGVHFLGSFQTAHSLTRNTIRNNGLNGVQLSGKMTITLDSNHIAGNGTLNIKEDGYGLKAHDQNMAPDIWLKGNTITDNNGLPIEGHSTIDIYNYAGILDQSDVGNNTTSSQEGLGVECPMLTEFVPKIGACFMIDLDQDAITARIDNCPYHPNTDQGDEDNDGIGTACDADEGIFVKGGPSLITAVDKLAFEGWAYSQSNGYEYLTPQSGPYQGKAGVVALNDEMQIYFPPGALQGNESIFGVKILKHNGFPRGAHTDVGIINGSYEVVAPRHRFSKYLDVTLKTDKEKVKLLYVGKMALTQFEDIQNEWVKRDADLDVINGVVRFRTTHFSWLSQAMGTIWPDSIELWRKGGEELKKAEQTIKNALKTTGQNIEGLAESTEIILKTIEEALKEKKLPPGFGIKIPPVSESLDSFDDCFLSVDNSSHCVERLADNGTDALARIDEIGRSCFGLDTLSKYIKPDYSEGDLKNLHQEVFISFGDHASACLGSTYDDRYKPKDPEVATYYAEKIRRRLHSMKSDLLRQTGSSPWDLEGTAAPLELQKYGLCAGLVKRNSGFGGPKKDLNSNHYFILKTENLFSKIPFHQFEGLGLNAFDLKEQSYRNCNVGDSILFSGLFLLGEWSNNINQGILAAQTDEGAPTRSVINKALQTIPRTQLIGYDTGFEEVCARQPDFHQCLFAEELKNKPLELEANFSKDMFLGILAQQVANNDFQTNTAERERTKSAFLKVIQYIGDHEGRMCKSSDDTCIAYPTYLALERYVQKHIGTRKNSVGYGDIFADDMMWLTMFSVIKNEFFNVHMASVHAYLKARMGFATASTALLTKFIKANDPSNLWYRFVESYLNDYSQSYSSIAADLVTKIDNQWSNFSNDCKNYNPLPNPTDQSLPPTPAPGCRTEWAWEHGSFSSPMGHELYLLGKLLLNDSETNFADATCGFEGQTGVPWNQSAINVKFSVPDPNIEIYRSEIGAVGDSQPTSFQEIAEGLETENGLYRFRESDADQNNAYKKNLSLKPGNYTFYVRHRFRPEKTGSCNHRIEKLPLVRTGVTNIFVTPGDCPSHYRRYEFNLNEGTAGGVPLYLCYELAPEVRHLVDITAVYGTSANCPEDYVSDNMDLNMGAKGEFIFLCQKADNTDREEVRPITDFFVYSSDTSTNQCPSGNEWHWIPVDLNRGAIDPFCYPNSIGSCSFRDAKDIYMCFKK